MRLSAINIWKKSFIRLILRLILGLVLMWAAVPKIADVYLFAFDIENYQILSGEASFYVALVLPWMEVILAVCLISGKFLRPAALWSAILMGVFLIALISAVWRGLDINCGCFGASSERISWIKIAEDLALFLMAIYLLLNRVPFRTRLHFKDRREEI